MYNRPMYYMYIHFYTHLFILNDKVTFIQYTEHSLQCSVYKTVCGGFINNKAV